MEKRKYLLERLLSLDEPLEVIMRDLDPMGWDWQEAELVNMSREHIISVLTRYLSNTLSEQQVEDWANAVEKREDITYGLHEDEDVIMEAIHDLANPVLEGALTPEMAKRIIADLGSVE